ncbi:MAG: SRPBCC family protein [Solirubrobacteraceae bacterium]|jgi:hypothetical protein|nr:SRPBCC family protein [Solirubrobacteraceae bacterium]
MGRARASIVLEGTRISDAERLWYDRVRWPAFVDGMKQVIAVEGDYPEAGAKVVWESFPGGRGRVTERVVAYEARAGQEIETVDAKAAGTQRVTFAADGDGVRMTLELDYRLLEPGPFSPITDLLFIRRAQGDALRRTLARFARELRDEAQPPL